MVGSAETHILCHTASPFRAAGSDGDEVYYAVIAKRETPCVEVNFLISSKTTRERDMADIFLTFYDRGLFVECTNLS